MDIHIVKIAMVKQKLKETKITELICDRRRQFGKQNMENWLPS